MRSSTETLIAACKELAATVQCDDGVANSALREIAERLEELNNELIAIAASSWKINKDTRPKRIAEAIENDLNDRRGLHIDSCDEETRKEILKEWQRLIAVELLR